MNAFATEVSVSVIAAFSADGRVYRFHGYVLGTAPSGMLLVPLGRSCGDLRCVVDCCPVPWGEVWATIDVPLDDPQPLQSETLCLDFPLLAQITPYGWVTDDIALSPFSGPTVQRLTHASGILFARSKQ